jgi:hypothetical protein
MHEIAPHFDLPVTTPILNTETLMLKFLNDRKCTFLDMRDRDRARVLGVGFDFAICISR